MNFYSTYVQKFGEAWNNNAVSSGNFLSEAIKNSRDTHKAILPVGDFLVVCDDRVVCDDHYETHFSLYSPSPGNRAVRDLLDWGLQVALGINLYTARGWLPSQETPEWATRKTPGQERPLFLLKGTLVSVDDFSEEALDEIIEEEDEKVPMAPPSYFPLTRQEFSALIAEAKENQQKMVDRRIELDADADPSKDQYKDEVWKPLFSRNVGIANRLEQALDPRMEEGKDLIDEIFFSEGSRLLEMDAQQIKSHLHLCIV